MRRTLIVLFLLFLPACGVTQNVQGRLEENRGTLTYVHESLPVQEKGSLTIAVRSFIVDDVIPAHTTVRKVSGSVLPLILFNSWKEDMQAELGYDRLENDYKRFMRDHFLEELRRSGKFPVKDGQADLNVSVRIRKVELSAPIRHRANFFFLFIVVGGGSSYSAGPVVATVSADVTIERTGAQVLSETMTGKYATNILEGRGIDLSDYTIAMIEGVSMAVKDLNEKIVRAVNRIG